MNVSIATVAKDVGTTVTGIQGAITAYTLVMASLMITGAKIGAIIGRKRVRNRMRHLWVRVVHDRDRAEPPRPPLRLVVLGGSRRGADPAGDRRARREQLPAERRPAAYGLVAAAGAIAVAVGPLIGGFFTTYFSWRWVFAGEVLVVLAILVLTRKIADAPAERRPRLDFVGTILSAAGLGMIVFGVLRTSEWGWFQPKPDGPSWAGLSPTVWLILGGLFVLWLFAQWELRRVARGEEPLVRPGFLRNKQLSGGLIMFFFQFLAQAGLFFVVPLYLSVCLGLSALETGARPLPLRHVADRGDRDPALFPNVSPRLVVRSGLLALLAGTVVLLGSLDADSGPEAVFVPMLLIGLGIGALASQLGAVTVSAVPDDQAPEVGGVQNTMTNLGASMGTAAGRFRDDRRRGDVVPREHPAERRDSVESEGAGPGRARGRRGVRLGRRPRGRARRGQRERPDDRGGARRLPRRPHRRSQDRACDPRRAGGRRALLRRAHPGRRRRGRRRPSLMCRWLAYSGSPIRLEELLVKRDRSLIDQSLHARQGATTTNGDGFGVGWYEEGGDPRLYRSTHPAWNDRNLREPAAGISSPLFFSHIRASTGSAIQEMNTHPFRYGRLWMHNGLIREFPQVRRSLVPPSTTRCSPRSRAPRTQK